MLKPFSLLAFSILLHLSGYYALAKRIEPFQYLFYVTSWWSYIIFLDAALALKEKRFLVLNRHIVPLVIISCGFWCLFELINIRLHNWHYINLPVNEILRYGGYLLSYGTVIPAIYLTKELVYILIGDIAVRPFGIGRYPAYAIPLGIAILLLTLAFPRYLFACAWIFAVPVTDGINYARGYRSFMKDLERGLAGHLISAVVAGLICGILWEMWNYPSVSKWIYSVPFLEKGKVFEMPLPGYLGFLAFGLETIAFFNFLEGVRRDKRSIYVMTVIIAVLISSLTFPLIDRFTVRW
ncbi:MAG: hypothetical protein A4E64_02991 [Syntrophorhabdus sp. PtaU1.Bin058]|nr:MAG: hypothetical protein A4E64_02991 [Syntrophorhabdus sp. PtaU1.Bin058]